MMSNVQRVPLISVSKGIKIEPSPDLQMVDSKY